MSKLEVMCSARIFFPSTHPPIETKWKNKRKGKKTNEYPKKHVSNWMQSFVVTIQV